MYLLFSVQQSILLNKNGKLLFDIYIFFSHAHLNVFFGFFPYNLNLGIFAFGKHIYLYAKI